MFSVFKIHRPFHDLSRICCVVVGFAFLQVSVTSCLPQRNKSPRGGTWPRGTGGGREGDGRGTGGGREGDGREKSQSRESERDEMRGAAGATCHAGTFWNLHTSIPACLHDSPACRFSLPVSPFDRGRRQLRP
jgi:hypothetical protein